jgi:hypothetical protein
MVKGAAIAVCHSLAALGGICAPKKDEKTMGITRNGCAGLRAAV